MFADDPTRDIGDTAAKRKAPVVAGAFEDFVLILATKG
jgi:hypothetical protein